MRRSTGSSANIPRYSTPSSLSNPEVDLIPIAPKLFRRFYEPLALLQVLDRNRGERIPRYTNDADSESDELRRLFVDCIAYICDYEKGGDTVTAATLQREPAGVTVWLAANTHVKAKTVAFLQAILDDLVMLVAFTKQPPSKSLAILRKEQDPLEVDTCEDISGTRAWLENLLTLINQGKCNVHELVQQCFSVRTRDPFQIVSRLAIGEQSASKHFGNLRHYIGRLGGYLRAVKVLVSAALLMPYLLDSFKIEVRRSSCSIPSPLDPDRIALDGIIGRAFHNEEDITLYRVHLASMDHMVDGGLTRGVKDGCSFTTRVHAELLLVDLSQEHQYNFVMNERYVGCSKPALYCCYQYILALRGGFSLAKLACHNNLYLTWRALDVPKYRGEPAVRDRRDVLNTMLIGIRDDLRRQIDSQGPRRLSQFDSLTGVTPLHDRDLPVEHLLLNQESPIQSRVFFDASDDSDYNGGVSL
ncbi:MAG: hypothetical protein M1830_004997 [Pleopsidium flavum]|nr:MAG: hypothetical protein M1830_004997 [Pleopsidium flavum]